jgi:hypothetical protein
VGLRTSLTSLPSWSVIREAQHRVVVHHYRGLIIESSDRTSSSSPPRTSSCKGGRWSLCTMWRSSSSSSLTGRRHQTSLLRPSSLPVIYVKRWCKWTLLSYSSHLLSTLSPPSFPLAIGNTTPMSAHRCTPRSTTACRSATRLGRAGSCEPNRPAGPFHELGHGPRSGVAS